MPLSAALGFASALTLAIQFLIFAYLYSTHRVRFFQYLLMAWGLMSVAKGLNLVRSLGPNTELLIALTNAVFFGATLLILAAGLAFRYDYRIKRRDLALGALGMLIAGGFGDMSDASATARSSAAIATGGVLFLASLQFWPRGSQSPSYRGSRFLAMSLGLWAVQRMGSPFIDPQPGTSGYLTMHMAFMFVYFLSTFAVIIMVLDRARSETAALKEFNERLVDGLGEGLQLVDGDFRIRHANRWMHRQFGAIAGRRCYEVITADGLQCPRCPLDRRHEVADVTRLEVTGDAGRRFSLSCAPVRQPDGQVFLLELVSDITERERLYARLTEAERLAATGELAAGVAHEIRNPLAAIVNATTLLSEGETLTPEERTTTLGAVRKEARRLNQILSDFLVFARPREPKRLVADIREVVDHVAALIREDPDRAQRVDVDVRIHPGVPSFAFDADQMTQVLWNVALNGIEAIEGHGRIGIDVELRGSSVAIAVSDTGRGMSPDERRRIFDPFYSRKPAGTGLGLTLARRIVTAHAGQMEVESTPGRGTRMTILLPLA
jgi:signal transduction histidine kinase